jgi:hypothetical protein
MTLITPHVVDHLRNDPATTQSVQQQLRALDKEYRDYQVALNQTQASLTHTIRLAEQNYHRRRKAIMSNGHDQDVQ